MATKKKAVKKAVKKKVVKKAVRKRSAPKTLFYCFRQNNSGGAFVYDAKRGISVNVIVEAYGTQDANDRAFDIGLYFDGEGDCQCCGSRWHEQQGYDKGTPEPAVYDSVVTPNSKFQKDDIKWMTNGEFEGFIHYVGGPVKFAGFWK